jgi:hypothetical protein
VIFVNYIVAAADGLYCFYYRDGGIWLCEYKGDIWSQARVLMPKAREDFTVNFVDGNVPFLIWQDDGGNLMSGRLGGGDMVAETLIVSRGELGQYRAISAEGGMNLVYSLPFSGDIHMLMMQFVAKSGAWGAVRRVDNISSISEKKPGDLFKLIPIADKHFLAIYQNTGFESRIGYKEIYGNEVGKYNPVHSSIHNFGDCSFLATKHDLHIACVVKGVFGSRLVYKKKGAQGLSPGVVVAEGQGLHNIALYMADEKPHLVFMRNENVYCVGAEEDGYKWSFLPLADRDGTRGDRLVKAVFLSGSGKEGDFFSNELLVDEERPWEIKVVLKHVLGPYKQNIRAQTEEKPGITEEEYNKFFNKMEDELTEFMNG